VIHAGMLYDPIQSHSHIGPKVAKLAKFKVCHLCRYARNQKTNCELWYSNAVSKF